MTTTDTAAPDVGQGTEVLAVVDRYPDAEAIVRGLAERDFPIEHIRIVGHGLELVERVTGRLTLGNSIARGAAGGALPGVLIGWIFGVFSWVSPLIAGLLLALYGLVFGLVLGAIAGAIYYAIVGDRRNFLSESTLTPSSYLVLVDTAYADRAKQLAGQIDSGPASAEGMN
jgi:hypothetical protein